MLYQPFIDDIVGKQHYEPFFLRPPEGGPILFLLSLEVSGTSGTMSIYIYVNNMADAKSVRNLSAIFG